MMTKSRKEIIERTMTNLRCVDERAAAPYEVTQLVNSFLMTLLQNWDDLESGWPHLSSEQVKWPKVQSSERNQQPKQCVGKIRDALAHGCFVFRGPDGGDIESMSMWTCPDRQTVDWDMTISVADMRSMLECFASLAAQQPLKEREKKQKGARCTEAVEEEGVTPARGP